MIIFEQVRRGSTALIRFEHRRHTSVAMNRNYSETSMISIPADKNNKAIILDVGGKKHKIRGRYFVLSLIFTKQAQWRCSFFTFGRSSIFLPFYTF